MIVIGAWKMKIELSTKEAMNPIYKKKIKEKRRKKMGLVLMEDGGSRRRWLVRMERKREEE